MFMIEETLKSKSTHTNSSKKAKIRINKGAKSQLEIPDSTHLNSNVSNPKSYRKMMFSRINKARTIRSQAKEFFILD